MIDKVALRSGITSTQLISHSQTITQTLREKSQESRDLSGLAREVSGLGKRLMQSVEAHKRNGVRVIVCDTADGLELDVKKVVKMLKDSSNALEDIARKFTQHAEAYDNQLRANEHLMTGYLSGFSLKNRVATCERQSNSRLSDQKKYLQRAMPKIEDAEMTVVGYEQTIGLPSNGMRLHTASQQLAESI